MQSSNNKLKAKLSFLQRTLAKCSAKSANFAFFKSSFKSIAVFYPKKVVGNFTPPPPLASDFEVKICRRIHQNY